MQFFCEGCRHQQDFFGMFDGVLFLDVDEGTILVRLEAHSSGYGKSESERNILVELRARFKAKMLSFNAVSVDTNRPPGQLAKQVVDLAGSMNDNAE